MRGAETLNKETEYKWWQKMDHYQQKINGIKQEYNRADQVTAFIFTALVCFDSFSDCCSYVFCLLFSFLCYARRGRDAIWKRPKILRETYSLPLCLHCFSFIFSDCLRLFWLCWECLPSLRKNQSNISFLNFFKCHDSVYPWQAVGLQDVVNAWGWKGRGQEWPSRG